MNERLGEAVSAGYLAAARQQLAAIDAIIRCDTENGELQIDLDKIGANEKLWRGNLFKFLPAHGDSGYKCAVDRDMPYIIAYASPRSTRPVF